MSEDDVRICKACNGPCKIPEFARDSSRFANDLFGFQAHMARVHQQWLDPKRVADVARTIAETRALPVIPTFPCVVCQKFAFNRDGVTCYWCGRGVPADARPPETVIVVKVAPDLPAPPAVAERKKAPIVEAPPSLFG